MKAIFVLFAILAFANCSTFLRSLDGCTALADLGTKETCEACAGTFADSACTCTDSNFKANVGCTKTCAGSKVTDITDHAVCLGCSGKWDSSKQSEQCSCPAGYTYNLPNGCAEEPTPTPTSKCEISKKSELAGITDGDKCTSCNLIWNSTLAADKRCSCPTKDTEKANIKNQTVCETVCELKWDKDAKACSGMYIKIASALFALLFLL